MKGPSGRLRYQVRRVWECPRCRRREWTGGHIVTQVCDCAGGEGPAKPVGMKLIEELPRGQMISQDSVAKLGTPPACDGIA